MGNWANPTSWIGLGRRDFLFLVGWVGLWPCGSKTAAEAQKLSVTFTEFIDIDALMAMGSIGLWIGLGPGSKFSLWHELG